MAVLRRVMRPRLVGQRIRLRYVAVALVVMALVVWALVSSLAAEGASALLVVISHDHGLWWPKVKFGAKDTTLFKDKQQQYELEEQRRLFELIGKTLTPSKGQTKFLTAVFDLLAAAKPQALKLDHYPSKERIYHARFDLTDDHQETFDENYLLRFLQLDLAQLTKMKQSHLMVVDKLPETAPAGLYNGDGIVYVGGGKFNWLTLLLIKALRDLGCQIPVEVLIPKTEEFESELCGTILPRYDARCIHMPLMLPVTAREQFKFKGYQYKVLAILLLRFENVLLLDLDNFAVRDPSHLFTEEPFTLKGLIVWPDFWKRATLPAYYKIAGVEPLVEEIYPKYNELLGKYEYQAVPEGVDMLSDFPLHERKYAIPDPTLELGQLMILKKSHIKPLLLALYYNLYGPEYYYPLFSQGLDGEGDKETFLAATVVTRKPFYQVGKFLDALGFLDDGNFVGTGMGQHDPVLDYQYQRAQLDHQAEMMFVHANFPKLDPYMLRKERKYFDLNGQRVRLYGTGMKVRAGYDFELVQWNNMYQFLCEDKVKLQHYEFVERDKLCKEIGLHIQFLKASAPNLE